MVAFAAIRNLKGETLDMHTHMEKVSRIFGEVGKPNNRVVDVPQCGRRMFRPVIGSRSCDGGTDGPP
jgi:hypothetical protein